MPPTTGLAWNPFCVAATVSYQSVKGILEGEVLRNLKTASTMLCLNEASLADAAVQSSQSPFLKYEVVVSGKDRKDRRRLTYKYA
jgi:hypothetical protein